VSDSTSLYGYLVEFDTEEGLVAAAERVRDAGYRRWDAHTPFAVHGLDGAMGIRATKLPLVVFAAGLTGTAAGILLQWYTNAFDYPFLISGKPFFSLPANIPVAFETTILFAALGALGGMLAFNGLPQLYHPLFSSARFRRATTDRFFISIEAADPSFDEEKTRELVDSLGAIHVEEVEA
jgi:hypothetical protein